MPLKLDTFMKFSKAVNIHLAFVLRLFIVMLLFSLCRIVFYIFNTQLFIDLTFGGFLRILCGGLRFDLTAMLYTNILYVLMQGIPFRFRYNNAYQTVCKWVFYITNGIAIALNCVDIIYYRFTLRRTTWSVVHEFSNDVGNFALMRQFICDYWYVLFVFAAFIFIMIILYNLIKINKQPIIKNLFVYYPINLFLFAAYIGLFVAGARGGFTASTRPITISNAAKYVERPIETGLVLNTPFSIYRTLERISYPVLNYFDEETLSVIYTPIRTPKDSAVFNQKNVVILIVESLSKEFIGSMNKDIDNYEGYTPFLDTLIAESYTFEHSFSNGTRSIEAMPSIYTSIPSFRDPYILSIYANNTVRGIAALLSEKGYDCSFFHGAPNGSMGFDSYAKASGFKNYYGMKEYGNDADFDGRWGIWDEPFLQFMANTLKTKQEPFFASVFTLSSHHPFKIPKEYEGNFPKGTTQIHQCTGYTDMALKKFFESISEMPWYKNTLFVITADHTNQVTYDKSKTSLGQFNIPIIFYDPSGELKGFEPTKVIQQIDIMPTVLGLLNYDKPYFAFGFDVFSKDTLRNQFAINYPNEFYQIIQDGYVLTTNSNYEPDALYSYKDDVLLQNNLKSELPEMVEHLNKLGKAMRQTYNNRLINNKMVANP